MTDLAGYGTISYNGVNFAGPRLNTHVEVDPQYDKSGREIVADKVTIYIRYLITSDTDGLLGPSSASDTTDNFLPEIHRRLNQTGGVLVYEGMGHGATFSINTGGVTDCEWGPKPGKATFKPVGRNLVIELDWSVSVAIKRCSPTTNALFGKLGNVKSLVYSTTYNIDAQTGLTNRNVSGELVICNNRASVGSQLVPYDADEYRSRFRVAIPRFFRRIQNQWKVGEDKSTLTFQIVDAEMESEYGFPEGVSDFELNHKASYSFRPNTPMTMGGIDGHFKVVKGFGVGTVWDKVLLIVRERIESITRLGSNVIINGLDVSEAVYSREVKFSVSYIMLPKNGPNMRAFVQQNALFTGTTKTSYESYARSMQNTAWNDRGVARLASSPNSDRLINQCSATQRITVDDVTTPRHAVGLGQSLISGLPDRASSYILWDNWVEYYYKPNRNIHVLMGQRPRTALDRIFTALDPSGDLGIGGGADIGQYVIQSDKSVLVFVRLRGRASRIGYDVEIPKLVSIWDRTPIMTEDGIRSKGSIVGHIGSLPVKSRYWDIGYIVTFRSLAEAQREIHRGERLSLETPDDLQGFKLVTQQPLR